MKTEVLNLDEGLAQARIFFERKEDALYFFLDSGITVPDYLEKAALKRRLDYLAGRYCVRLCYDALSLKNIQVPPVSSDRSPIWPKDILGSITHTEGYCTSIVGKNLLFNLIGVDAEKVIEEVRPNIINHICFEEKELFELSRNLRIPENEAMTIIFSAKETFYKAIYPKVKKYFGFNSACVYYVGDGLLEIKLTVDLDPSHRKGQSWSANFSKIDNNIWETKLIRKILI